ncbi:hypothetical protein N7488_001245 [Penicillium malachiteum]|nr:hypothetical protein N7488_001245 [Penicillium malachiteum]
MDSTQLKAMQDRLTAALVQVSRNVNQLASEDLNFHRASSGDFTESIDEQSERILALTSKVLQIAVGETGKSAPTLEDEDSIEDNWRDVVDVIDSVLERADACLDEFTGVIKKLSPSEEEQAPLVKKAPKFPTIYDYGPSKIPKPQLLFDRKVDNSSAELFRPLLKVKPHAIVPLEDCLKTQDIDGKEGYPTPYETEIRASKYPKSVYEQSPPIDYLPFESTTATFVDTLDGVKEMLKELKQAKEIAIDLEHHDVHSYAGLVSLMQISTREKDWVVDTLKPWREELQILNEVFTDPKILKVLHGSFMDIIWLQRDLGLYVVGMFDTFHAANALGYPKRSLKFLLQKFVNFEADKRYQMADWRIRPLPSGMFDYARSDTHYLLFVYDHLRNELLQASTSDGNLIDQVNERSQNAALQRYDRPVYDEAHGQGQGGWYDMLCRTSGVLSKEQFAVFKAAHKWRDEVARAEDEGVQCVFPKHVLFRLAQTMPLDMGVLLRTLSPMTPITKARADDLLDVIKEAKLAGADGPEWRDVAPPPKTVKPFATESKDEDFLIPERFKTTFFGEPLHMPSKQISPEHALAALKEAHRLAFPSPPVPTTVQEVRENLAIKTTPVAPPTEQPAPAPAPVEPEEKKVFTVKELGGPRKRKVTPVDQPTEDLLTLEPSDDDIYDEETEAKRRKMLRKEKKKAKKAAKVQAESTPFDYGAADSVLNSSSAQTSEAQPKRKKTFDPYKKALEAPSGVRKLKRDESGKSLTFRK